VVECQDHGCLTKRPCAESPAATGKHQGGRGILKHRVVTKGKRQRGKKWGRESFVHFRNLIKKQQEKRMTKGRRGKDIPSQSGKESRQGGPIPFLRKAVPWGKPTTEPEQIVNRGIVRGHQNDQMRKPRMRPGSEVARPGKPGPQGRESSGR